MQGRCLRQPQVTQKQETEGPGRGMISPDVFIVGKAQPSPTSASAFPRCALSVRVNGEPAGSAASYGNNSASMNSGAKNSHPAAKGRVGIKSYKPSSSTASSIPAADGGSTSTGSITEPFPIFLARIFRSPKFIASTGATTKSFNTKPLSSITSPNVGARSLMRNSRSCFTI